MFRVVTVWLFVVWTLSSTAAAGAFDFASYKPGDLDEILARRRPKTGMDVVAPEKLTFRVTLTAYAERCDRASAVRMAASFLPDVYPRQFLDTLSKSQCVKVRSVKGAEAQLAIQDSVATFLPKEVPLGRQIQVYCVLVCITSEGPGMIVTEFKAPDSPKARVTSQGPRMGDLSLIARLSGKDHAGIDGLASVRFSTE